MATGSQILPKVASRLVLLLVSAGLALGLVEILLRVLDYSPAVSGPLTGFHVADEQLGWIGIPDHRARFKTLNFDVLVETDGEGFRRVVSGVDPAEGAPEVWVLGDSTVWGWGVADGELFVDQLQELAGPSVRLRNFGINAYGTLQVLLLLERLLASRPAPAKVLLMVCDNDFDDNLSDRNRCSPCLVPAAGGEGFEIANLPVERKIGGFASNLARQSRAVSFLFYCSALAKQLRDRPAETAEMAKAVPKKPGSKAASPARIGSPKREAMEHLLGRFAARCAEHGAALDVIPFPRPAGPHLRSAASMTLEEICADLPQVNFVELETGMAEGDEVHHLGRGDFHWNAAGNRRGAEVYFGKAGPRLGVGG